MADDGIDDFDHDVGITHHDIWHGSYARAMLLAIQRMKSEYFPEHLSLIEDTNEVAQVHQGHVLKMGREALKEHYENLFSDDWDGERRDIAFMTMGLLYGRVLQEFDSMTIFSSIQGGHPTVRAGKNTPAE